MEDIRYILLWGVSLGILHPAFGIPAGVGDILIGVTAIPFAYFLWKGFTWSKYALVVWSVLGIADSSQCSQPWFDHCFGIWRINNDIFPVGSSTYYQRTSCTCAAWNYTLPSKEYIIYFRE